MILKLRYYNILSFVDDFKPASVDTSKNATVEIGGSNNVTVTVPHSGERISDFNM